LIKIYFIEPHSEKIQDVSYGWNDFISLKIMENEGDFRILKKFYPIVVQEIKFPLLSEIINTKNK
jgi:hypothetical protein